MHNFDFKLKGPAGRIETGRIKATSREGALKELKDRKTGRVIHIKKASAVSGDLRVFDKAPNGMVLSLFCSQLGMMVRAGVSQSDSLSALIKTTDNRKLQEALVDVRNRVELGQPITEAMTRYPQIFDRSFLALLTTALKTNTVPEMLERLSMMYERNHTVAQEVKSALVQPMITVTIAIAVMFLVSIMVIPQFEGMLRSLNVELPVYTRMLLAVTQAMRNPLILLTIAAGLFGLSYSFGQAYRNPKGRKKIDELILRIPKIGTLVRLGALSRVNRTLSTLLSHGVGKVEALDIAARASGNTVIEDILLEGKKAVASGQHLYQVLERYPKIFPATISGMVNTGEEQGELARMLDRVSDFYERQVESDAKNLNKFIEPSIYVLIGVMVMGLIMATLMPIMSVVSNLN